MENTDKKIKETTGTEVVEDSENLKEKDMGTPSMNKKERKRFESLEKEIEALRKKMQETETKLTEETDNLAKTKDSYLRLMAEFDNYRRRTAQERLDLVATAAEDTIKGLLVVLDDCERAMKALAESDDSPVAKEGTELIYNKLLGYLKTRGLTVIDALGCDFDTDVHEAVAQLPVQEEDKKGKVYDVVLTGYKLNGKVIRFAKVVVGI
ncbi:MAG: nucleotide exchange factor GrpE [Candidatus Cryptobacteroides sp.]